MDMIFYITGIFLNLLLIAGVMLFTFNELDRSKTNKRIKRELDQSIHVSQLFLEAALQNKDHIGDIMNNATVEYKELLKTIRTIKADLALEKTKFIASLSPIITTVQKGKKKKETVLTNTTTHE